MIICCWEWLVHHVINILLIMNARKIFRLLKMFSFRRSYFIPSSIFALILTTFLLISYGWMNVREQEKVPYFDVKRSIEWVELDQKHLQNFTFSFPVLKEDITLVTGYFHLPNFQKGEGGPNRTPFHYKQWMKLFAQIENPVVAFFEDETTEREFRNIRGLLPKNITKTYLCSRQEMWAFSLQTRIANIYRTVEYPKHIPNTIVPAYPCVMHAKYELMMKVSEANPFKTQYIAWIDIGLFRGLLDRNDKTRFKLHLPPSFDNTKIAYTQVEPKFDLTIDKIFKENYVLLCGCFFLGSVQQMKEWTSEYMQYTENYLNRGLANTDQQVLYAMLNDDKHPKVQVQMYSVISKKYSVWFSLGYLCKETTKTNISDIRISVV